MAMEKGNLSIHSENIFPIIKKWLYSDHDIFIRELVSNACDAITKVKRLSTLGDADLQDQKDFKVEVILDKDAKTLTFSDNGIGMTDEEIKKYINQIAFSGAEDFIEKYKDKGDSDQIIGHFGLGFYSAFMVADKVEIHTKSHLPNSKAVKWHCDGGIEFEMEEGERELRGTQITLFLGDEGVEFLNGFKVKETLNKYCSFMPYPVYFKDLSAEPKKDEEGNVIVEEPVALNDVMPLYAKRPNECTEEEYKEFYRNTFKDFKEPLFWIHLNMDYPFNLKGILYFPKLSTEFDTLEGQIKLYNSQVFVADNIKEVIPEFLLLLKGVIDCPDLPLNVSRSFLQNDGFVKKISDYITKKVGDKITSLQKTDRESYEKYWDDIHPFIKFGALKDEKFADRVKDSILFKDTADNYLTINEYTANEDTEKKVIYYATDIQQQAQYIKLLKEHGFESAILDHHIDSPFISMMESKYENLEFKRVDADLSDLLEETEADEEADKDILGKIESLYKRLLDKESFSVQIQTLKSKDVAGMIILSEESRRMQDMMRQFSMSGMDPNMFPTNESLVLNKNHPLVKYTLDHAEDNDETAELVAQQIYDLAMMSHKPLEADAMTDFIKRSNEIMQRMITK
jgi:molecular chaperone HtpG